MLASWEPGVITVNRPGWVPFGWLFFFYHPQQVVSGGFSIGNGYQTPPVGGSRYGFSSMGFHG